MAGKKDEDSFNLIIGLILMVIVALIIIFAFSSIKQCPEGTFSCDNSISSCGCCIEDAYGVPIESCDYGICPEGTYFFEGQGCCPSPNPVSCLKEYKYCKNLFECGDNLCCAPDRCEIQSDGSSKCIPCSVGAICNPEDVNSCCEGLACSSDGFCKKIDSCVGMICENYNSPCQVCGEDSTDCLKCEDNAICYKAPDDDKGVCKQMCDANHPACPECPSGCCNPDGSCTSCLNNPCTSPGNPCALSSNIPCSEICANVDGIYMCKSPGNCPPGYVGCDCATGCCDAITGECLSCTNMTCDLDGFPCMYCEPGGEKCITCGDTICQGGKCVNTDDICVGSDCSKPPICETGYTYNETSKKCEKDSDGGEECVGEDCLIEPQCAVGYYYIDPPGNCFNINFGSFCIPLLCINKVEGASCSLEIGDTKGKCDNTCQYVDDELKCLPKENVVPDWLLNMGLSCIEVCEDCKPKSCDYSDMNIYDLNKDTYLNGKDLQVFDEYYIPLNISGEIPKDINNENQHLDFNNDEVIDEEDRNCLLGACGDGTCRIIGFEELGVCVTDKYFYNSYSVEQRAAMNIDAFMFNSLEVPYKFSCSFTQERNRPYCTALGSELSNTLLVRNLSYVMLDKDNNFYHYSTCNYIGNGLFSSYVESTTCSNEIKIYNSKEFYYRVMAYGMAVFNNCVKNTPKFVDSWLGDFEGNCQSFSDNIKGSCVMESLGSSGFYDCQTCKDCLGFEMSGGYCESVLPTPMEESKAWCLANKATCLKCPQGDTATCMKCGFGCQIYYECLKCKDFYPGSDTCTKCDNCDELGDNVYDSCSNEYKTDSVNSLLTKYKSRIDLCSEYSDIGPSNCIVYIECMDRFNSKPFCRKMAIDAYWMKDNDIFSKELFCYFDTGIYQINLNNRIITYTEKVMKQAGGYEDDVKGTFAGFIDSCPFEGPVECMKNCYSIAFTCFSKCKFDKNINCDNCKLNLDNCNKACLN